MVVEKSDKIEKIEVQMFEQQKMLGKMEGILETIARNLELVVGTKDDVITLKEKLKVTEARLAQIEGDCRTMQNAINGVHIKIAMFSGIWSAIIYYISNIQK